MNALARDCEDPATPADAPIRAKRLLKTPSSGHHAAFPTGRRSAWDIQASGMGKRYGCLLYVTISAIPNHLKIKPSQFFLESGNGSIWVAFRLLHPGKTAEFVWRWGVSGPQPAQGQVARSPVTVSTNRVNAGRPGTIGHNTHGGQ